MHPCVIRTVEKEKFAGYVGSLDIHSDIAFKKGASTCYPITGFVGLNGVPLSFAGILRTNIDAQGYVARLGLENLSGVIDKVFLLNNYVGIKGYYAGIFVYVDIEKTSLEEVISSLEKTMNDIRTGTLRKSDQNTAEFEIGSDMKKLSGNI